MKLSKQIAEKVAKEMMNIIPYNINLMNEKGIIFGSGDKKRIGTLHKGASKVLVTQKIYEVYMEEESMKPGVNEPIVINDEIIGVIGITGHPDEVRPFSKLVGATAKLLIEQESVNKKMQNDRMRREKFYNELLLRKTCYDDEFLQQGKFYGIDLTQKCQAIVIKGNLNTKAFKTFLEDFRHYSSINPNKIVLFITEQTKVMEVIKGLIERIEIEKIAIGNKEELAAVSLEQADSAWEVGNKIKPSEKVYYYDDFKLFIHLASCERNNIDSSLAGLDKSGNNKELFHTLQIFIEENGDIHNTTKKLNIHRNTLNYRLEKIKDLTGKNPKVFLELFELLCSMIWYK
ncbi:CdaR family transcriptional regulator [Niallia sp. FSL W8-0635]|uniref:CdaR family transcriptional regulator n=1 Tax=Niallia sp. FSL W8-0635 TaxID=2975337 RepID=UPI0009C94825|nr:Sugar diacid regulator [Mycobacteroides abscessus subsp. abscessus]HEO8420680.1 helix-turn-helix domain-containing protein [Yersinia enterocolitica]